MKLFDCVSGLYGVDNWDSLTRPESFVLIDDMPRQSILIRYKMDWLGKNRFSMSEADYEKTLDRHHIQCSPFDGADDVAPLTELLEIIHRYLKQ